MMTTTQSMGMTKRVAILCLAAVAVPAAADDHAPRSLRMREPPARTRLAPIPPGRRVAQRPPDPPSGDPPADPAPADPPPADPPPVDPPPADAPGAPAGDAPAPSPAPSTAPPPPASPASPPASPSSEQSTPGAADNGKTEVITVTDSPIERELLTGRAPVSVVTRADLAASGRATLGDILQALPAQANGANAQVNAGGDGTTRINLRGLGAPRTLVLVNGRRMVNGGSGADASADITTIPLAMVERVEILKDGASMLYGADAIGGVVNIITRPQFDGTDVTVLTSTSQHGDGTELDASAVTGFASEHKNSYLVLSAGYQHHEPVLAGDRGFSQFQNSYDFASKAVNRNQSLAAASGRLDPSSIGPGGMVPPGCAAGACKPAGNGGWTDFVAPGDLYNDAAQNYLYTPSTRYSAFATAGNRINEHATVLFEASYMYRTSDRQLSPVGFDAETPISKFSIYNPLRGDILDYRRRLTELGPRGYVDQVTTRRLVLGITGSVPESWGVLENWKYEVSYNYGIGEARVGTTGQLDKLHVADALGPSMLDASGTPICVKVPGNAATKIIYQLHVPDEQTSGNFQPVSCVPLNLLAPAGAIPAAQLKNLTFNDIGTGADTLHTYLASASGRVAQLPNHGEINLAIGGDARYEIGEHFPPVVASSGDTTDNQVQDTHGRFHMFEGFGELAIVPITGGGLAQRVEIDLGAHAVRNNRFGSSLTYKAGGLVRTALGVAVRGTYATAFRAPSVFDLFGGHTVTQLTLEDPCDAGPPSVGNGTRTLDPMVQAQCTAQGIPAGARITTSQQPAAVGGNPDLQAETAATTTVGLVVEPPWLKGLSVSADYWHIGIDNAIESLGVPTILASCYDRGIQSFCNQIRREFNTHRILHVDQFLQNVHRTVTSGIDLAVWYDTRFVELGRLHTGLEAQYLLRYDLDTGSRVVHGVGYYDLGVYPRYKANLSSRWIHPSGVTGGFTLRYVGSFKECAGDDCNSPHNLAALSRDVGRYFKLDLFGAYDLPSWLGRTTLQLGVNNVFNAAPPAIYNAAAGNSDAATYDFLGRMVYLRLSQLF
jgi:outer membrane receptor protein involved in Fe transport